MLFKTPFKTASELGIPERTHRGLVLALEHLETHEDATFDMFSWSCCFRGWAEKLLGGKLIVDIVGYPTSLSPLFIPRHKPLDRITREEGTAALRNYLLTGNIEWE